MRFSTTLVLEAAISHWAVDMHLSGSNLQGVGGQEHTRDKRSYFLPAGHFAVVTKYQPLQTCQNSLPGACMQCMTALPKVSPVVSRTFGADEDLVLMGGGEIGGGGGATWARGHDVIVRPCNPLAPKPNQQRLAID